MRYVAQENIDPLLTEGDGGVSDGFPLEIGKWFKRWDREAGVFVSNVRDEYPDD